MLLAESLLGSSSVEPAYIEDVFSTFLYTGNGSTQTVTNGINTLTPGALVWIKRRSNTTDHALYDRVRGVGPGLASNLASAAVSDFGIIGFGTTGFTLGSTARVNTNGAAYVSWTFREQPRFFDVVTYAGNGANRTIAHNLQSVPGCIMVKRTDTTGDWQVYHRSLANTQYMVLNSNGPVATGADRWNSTTPTAAEFSLGTNAAVNANGGTYVAYLFAHDAGGFGATGADNAISCGSFTTDGSGNATVTLGYEPQFLLTKNRSFFAGSWQIRDIFRGFSTLTNEYLFAESNGLESGTGDFCRVTPTGFNVVSANAGNTYIYIAIRRGPMRTPTSGTSVFNPAVYTGTNVNNRLVNTTLAPDMVMIRQRNDNVLAGMVSNSRLVGRDNYLLTGSTTSEVFAPDSFDRQLVEFYEYGDSFSAMNGFWCGNDATAKLNVNTTSNNHVVEAFRRAPGFFDVVCYTGTGFVRTVNHNLGVAPELMLIKHRNATNDWQGYAAPLGAGKYLVLNSTAGQTPSVGNDFTRWNATAPTANVFTVSFDNTVNASGGAYIAYLFASCPGVSKVGSYTGTGTTQTINCGFTTGARFVLIKRTDSTGDWYVWDTARGIVAANDPRLSLNSTAAEVTNTDWVDTAASGFELSNAAGNLVNTNGGSYIFLAIA